MLATVANAKEKKKLAARSREIVIKARGEQIDEHTIGFSGLIGKNEEKKGNEQHQEKPESIPQQANKRKITLSSIPKWCTFYYPEKARKDWRLSGQHQENKKRKMNEPVSDL